MPEVSFSRGEDTERLRFTASLVDKAFAGGRGRGKEEEGKNQWALQAASAVSLWVMGSGTADRDRGRFLGLLFAWRGVGCWVQACVREEQVLATEGGGGEGGKGPLDTGSGQMVHACMGPIWGRVQPPVQAASCDLRGPKWGVVGIVHVGWFL